MAGSSQVGTPLDIPTSAEGWRGLTFALPSPKGGDLTNFDHFMDSTLCLNTPITDPCRQSSALILQHSHSNMIEYCPTQFLTDSVLKWPSISNTFSIIFFAPSFLPIGVMNCEKVRR